MPTLADFTAFAMDLEKGVHRLKDRGAAVKRLIAEICGATWTTAEDRSEAQRLVGRLDRLMHTKRSPGQGKAAARTVRHNSEAVA